MTTEATDFPAEECDLVMKGGITSGVVYPPAVLELARRYRFHSIGGASAGAIAAVLTAAAEYGRQVNKKPFADSFGPITRKLQTGSFVLDLFQPQQSTRAIFDTAIAYKRALNAEVAAGLAGSERSSPLAAALRALATAQPRMASRGVLVGLAAGAILGAATGLCAALVVAGSDAHAILRGVGVFAAVGGIAGAVAGGPVACLLGLYRSVKAIASNDLGICRGLDEGSGEAGAKPALTNWLHDSIAGAAGLDPRGAPLTFGDLKKAGVELRTVTTNLSQGQPYVIPFGAESKGHFIVKQSELAAFFPAAIIQHLTKERPGPKIKLPVGYFYLPPDDELPILLAARLSLSFPGLVSAIPLYTVDYTSVNKEQERYTEAQLQRNWFSDGGICSNFPIHFFDSWVPSRPTFGIRLASSPEDGFEEEGGRLRLRDQFRSAPMPEDGEHGPSELVDVADARGADEPRDMVHLPRANDPAPPEWRRLCPPSADAPGGPAGNGTPSLARFVGAIVDAMQEHRDNMQAALPSYRERVVVVRLKDNEGGLNLDMPEDVIERIADRGTTAGQQLRDEFLFPDHQWVRFQVIMAQLEAQLTDLKNKTNATFRLEDVVAEQASRTTPRRFPYRRGPDWCAEAQARFDDIVSMVKWTELHFKKNVPKPEGALRVTPRV